MYLLRSFLINAARGHRHFATTSALQDTRSLVKLKKLQSDYQAEDGRPIWLKAGLRDRILYTTTLLLCAVGLIGVVTTLYSQAIPPSWKKPC